MGWEIFFRRRIVIWKAVFCLVHGLHYIHKKITRNMMARMYFHRCGCFCGYQIFFVLSASTRATTRFEVKQFFVRIIIQYEARIFCVFFKHIASQNNLLVGTEHLFWIFTYSIRKRTFTHLPKQRNKIFIHLARVKMVYVDGRYI